MLDTGLDTMVLFKNNYWFPYEKTRPGQQELIEQVSACLKKRQPMLVHAPTGLGKTASVLSPALQVAKEYGLKVWFLTSRNSQHLVAMDALKDINERYGLGLRGVDLIGKSHFCIHPSRHYATNTGFHDWCEAVRDKNNCTAYQRSNVRFNKKGINHVLAELAPLNLPAVQMIEAGNLTGMCPYELTANLVSKADLIVGDYYYLFSEGVRNSLLKRMGMSLDRFIVVVDEAHNLPARIRSLMSLSVTDTTLINSIKNAKRMKLPRWVISPLGELLDYVLRKSENLSAGCERLIDWQEVSDIFPDGKRYEVWLNELEELGEYEATELRSSPTLKVVAFARGWLEQLPSYMYQLKVKGSNKRSITLMRRCLDPSVVTKDLFNSFFGYVCMSATFLPLAMYRDVLGVQEPHNKIIDSPFPPENQLTLVVNDVTTEYKYRSDEMYDKFAGHVSGLVDKIPGNVMVFFASYAIRNEILKRSTFNKPILLEEQGTGQKDKDAVLDKFKKTADTGGSVLAGAISGSFGEGVDLPGNLVNGVLLCGLPLQKPDLETDALVAYYKKRFSRGWDYGYVFPAMNRALQAAGRCIRSPKDKGTVVFLDRRYLNSQYRRCLPSKWELQSTDTPIDMVEEFFKGDIE